MSLGILPSALEFIERDAWNAGASHLGMNGYLMETQQEAALLIEVDGNNKDQLLDEALHIAEILEEQFAIGEPLLAQTVGEQELLWSIRRSIGEAIKTGRKYIEEDTVVPRSHIVDIYTSAKEACAEADIEAICYGHAGDGNLHINILQPLDMKAEDWNKRKEEAILAIFRKCVELGGTISGEHGIGYTQKPYLKMVHSLAYTQLCKELKQVFDPYNILNPDKIWA